MSAYNKIMLMSFYKTLKRRETRLVLTCLAFLAMIVPLASWAAKDVPPATNELQKIQLVAGKSIVLKSDGQVKRVSIANPEIADFVLLSPNEIYINGKATGITTLMLWEDKAVSKVYDLEVALDVSRLKEKLHQLLPDEKELRVMATHNAVTLFGRVSSTPRLSQALALAGTFAPEGGVRNLLEVGGVHQVMLEVRVAEMQRSVTKRLGFNLTYLRGNEFGVTTLGGLTQVVKPNDANVGSGGPFGLFVSPAVNALFRIQSNSATWTSFVDALREDGLAKILAEPTLIALSGQSAYFLAGGEFPVPIPQGLGTVAIEYKPFGVGLSFTPTVLDEKRINIKVVPEVSELDFSTSVQFQGFVIPGLSTRKAATVVELADGQSFAIAGLLRENVRDAVSRYPLLGDIPVLGALFRSRNFQKDETELVIIATPHIVKPLDMAKQSLPTDYYVEPNDQEIYLLGLLEGRKKSDVHAIRGKMEGEFGHVVPGKD